MKKEKLETMVGPFWHVSLNTPTIHLTKLTLATCNTCIKLEYDNFYFYFYFYFHFYFHFHQVCAMYPYIGCMLEYTAWSFVIRSVCLIFSQDFAIWTSARPTSSWTLKRAEAMVSINRHCIIIDIITDYRYLPDILLIGTHAMHVLGKLHH